MLPYLRSHPLEGLLRLFFGGLLATLMVTRLVGAGLDLRFAFFCGLVVLVAVGLAVLSLGMPLKPKCLWVFIPFCLLGYLMDPTALFCDLSRYALSDLLYVLCHLASGLVLGYVADGLTQGLSGLRFHLGRLFWGTVAGWNLFALWYTLSSKIVYYWDNAGYWDTAQALSAFEPGFLEQIVYSIQFSDYNNLIALPVAGVMRLFGGSRLVFVLAIVNLFLLPTYALLFQLVTKHWLLVLLSPAPLYMALTGFIDVGAMLVATLAIYFALQKEMHPRLQYFSVGICAVMTFVLRRYFMFFAFALLAVLFCTDWLLRKEHRKDLWVLVVTPLAFAFYAMQPYLVDNVLFGNFGEQYAGYQLGLSTDFFFFIRYFGLLWLVLMVVALVRGFCLRNRTTILCGSCFVLCFGLFVSLQSHGQQHLLMYFPLALILLTDLAEVTQDRRVQLAFLTGAVLTTAYPFVPKEQPQSIQEVHSYSLLPTFTLIPPTRGDIDGLVELQQYVDNLSTPEYSATVALVSSSLALNLSTMTHLYGSLNMQAPEVQSQWLTIPEIDGRDSYESRLFQADYILVADPVQLHLAPEYQTSISQPHSQLMEGQRQDYRQLGDSILVGDITVYAFQRVG